ncbi:uncharacterized protein [Ptychodera flava]|uniref:uncharacterized protein n=1 Tax=Ptychodera flava TaxID=63121 RepID=UPI00396A8CD4
MGELHFLYQAQVQTNQPHLLRTRQPPLVPTIRPAETDHSARSSKGSVAHRQVTQLDPDVLQYVRKAKKHDIEDIESSYGVLVTSSHPRTVDLYDKVARDTDGNIRRACASFLRLYEDSRGALVTHPDRSIDLKTVSVSPKEIVDAIAEVNDKHRGVWVKGRLDDLSVVFYGTSAEVPKARDEFVRLLTKRNERGDQRSTLPEHPLQSNGGGLHDSTYRPSGVLRDRTYRSSGVFHNGAPVMEPNVVSSDIYALRTKQLEEVPQWQRDFDGVNLKISQSNLTQERVDAIVCDIAADYQLRTSLAKQIEGESGGVILYDLRSIAQNYGLLQVKSIMSTSGGTLPSRHVIFAVLPSFNSRAPFKCREMLFGCLADIFDYADRYLHANSIAMASLGTGTAHGFQTKAFAQTLLAAINAFSTEFAGRRNLREISLVDRRKEKVEQLKDVFEPQSRGITLNHAGQDRDTNLNRAHQAYVQPMQRYRRGTVSRESVDYKFPIRPMPSIGESGRPVDVAPFPDDLKLDKKLNQHMLANQVEAQRFLHRESRPSSQRTDHPAVAPSTTVGGDSRPPSNQPTRIDDQPALNHSAKQNVPRATVDEPIEPQDGRTENSDSQLNGSQRPINNDLPKSGASSAKSRGQSNNIQPNGGANSSVESQAPANADQPNGRDIDGLATNQNTGTADQPNKEDGSANSQGTDKKNDEDSSDKNKQENDNANTSGNQNTNKSNDNRDGGQQGN